MKSKTIAAIMLVAMLGTILLTSTAFSQGGSYIDVLRHKVIKSPDAALIAMQTDIADMSPDQIRTGDIEKQDADGMLITEDLGFHMGYIAWNIRSNQTYRRTVDYWPPADIAFRHALIHCYDQLGIIPPIYGYIVTPVRSLVPPAQSKYYNPAVPDHPYNPGSPFTSTPGDGTSCGILMAGGYTFQDLGTTGVVDDADYWKTPGDYDMPYLEIWTPLIGVAPTSWQHGQEFVADLAEIGLAATTANGDKGIASVGRDFNDYLEDVYDFGDFDAFMVFYTMGRIPDQLYSFLHSSQDVRTLPGADGATGLYDPAIDTLCETVKFSLDADEIETAAKEIQRMLYTETEPNAENFALAYMLLYSRSLFNAFGPRVTGGVVKSPGYGSDNSWTHMNIRTTRDEGGKEVMIYINGDEPSSFNPCYATTAYEWNIIGWCFDGATAVNPYNHYDIPWLATDWTITSIPNQGPYSNETWMDVDFTLRSDVEWQDGHSFVASDVEFCLEFLRDYSVPRYAATWAEIDDVEVVSSTEVTIHSMSEGIGLFYDYSGLIALLPPQVWDQSWASNQAVLDYDPTEPYNVATGYTDGPNPPDTNLFGTGPFIFKFYDAVNMYDDMWKNPNYFLTITDIEDLKTEMFWQVGDYNRDGLVNVLDLTFVSFGFGCIEGLDPCYTTYIDADFNEDGIIDTRDISNAAYHLLWQKEYP
jgi:ABC-type transport system substrate-binding protein